VIGFLRGSLARKLPQEVLVDVSGVGYRVAIPLSTFYRLPEIGADVRLHIHTHVREDALQLFGFLSEREHLLFGHLIAATGVGPRLALSILSGIEADELARAIRDGDIVRLTRVPGVGKKTAERLILELKERMPHLGLEEESQSVGPREDLISALLHLGYSRPDAERAADGTLRSHADATFEELLRESLQVVARRGA
jgi:holliday junction DNA helicase RuvA